MASTAATRTAAWTRKYRGSSSCSTYNTGRLPLPGPVCGLPSTRPSQSNSVCCPSPAIVPATVAINPAVHISYGNCTPIHARVRATLSPGHQLLSCERSLSNLTFTYTTCHFSRSVKFSDSHTGAYPGRCASRCRSDCRGKAQTQYCRLRYVADQYGRSRIATEPSFSFFSTLPGQEKGSYTCS